MRQEYWLLIDIRENMTVGGGGLKSAGEYVFKREIWKLGMIL